jgi:hypothetical protein
LRIRRTLLRTLAATLIMAAPVFLVDYGLSQTIFADGGRFGGVVRAGVGGLLGGAVFLSAALLLRLEEIPGLAGHFSRLRRSS